ncbi:GlxA family transcriptional regulator [Chromobacterium alticapitis]|uniref:AraC family transcriptional regulator n=1 Tax=Chromobacterium alticapitis TaxID=2073169 RepID=A0A2S5DFP9_9NEIS|nr:GlxA family transcriptional regulator [Chromobacterium alticapitis]POZ61817.1 AraC family transcriptional regulator [Chromobacterium alticapitis]
MAGRKLPLRVVLLAHEDMNLLDLSGPLQALFTASRHSQPPLYELIVASEGGGLVACSAGPQLMTVALSSLDGLAIDTLIAPGGCRGAEYYVSPFMAGWLRERAPSARRVCSICTGAFLLAEAGLLDGRRATTHWEWAERLQSACPMAEIDPDKIFIRDGAVWTSAGVSAGIDLALALIEEDFGHQAAIETARQLVMFIKRAGGQSQFSAPLAAQAADRGHFSALHGWMADHLDQDLRVDRLAAQAGMTPRTFARVYAAQTGQTPARMVEAMRLEAACRALEETDLPLKRIAALCGLGDEQNLRRVFLRRMGVTPGQYRGSFAARGDMVPPPV